MNRIAVAIAALLALSANAAVRADGLTDAARDFASPPDAARPWVYWYFMDGNMTREGMSADLQAWKRAGIGGGILLEVDVGIPRGPVEFLSDPWLRLVADAVHEADHLGLDLAIGTGPGWCGTGGPWVTPAQSMQHLVASHTLVTGPTHVHAALPQPTPRDPYFGMGTLTPSLKKQWADYYRDEAVVAYPTPRSARPIANLDRLALYYRDPFSSGTVAPLYPFTQDSADDVDCVPAANVVDLTSKMKPDGTLDWDAPDGRWTIVRFGRTSTGQSTRPAPASGLGFETDKFEPAAIDAHLDRYLGKILDAVGEPGHAGHGLTTLHFDSWEMGAQNWSEHFREAFAQRRGYDPLPYLPVMAGQRIGSDELSQRFLWDVRQTAQELIVANHAGRLRDAAHRHGLLFSVEPYDLNPSADLNLGGQADVPMGEFWSQGFGFAAEYSVAEAVSVGHTNGKPIVGAESFTANPGEDWRQHPASMKRQTDWAFCQGLNRIVFHRYQHQPTLTDFPGMTMGPYGVHWERTQTFWDMLPAYHGYIARCSAMLRRGLPVVDVLYLASEGAPHVYRPPTSSVHGPLQDHRGYNGDGCDPLNLIAHATVKDGRVTFPDGMSYRLLVLPRTPAMTPALLRKLRQLMDDGATILGRPPTMSPSLSDYPHADADVKAIAGSMWGDHPRAHTVVPDVGQPDDGRDPLEHARWIWTDEGDAARAAPVGSRRFRRAFRVADPSTVVAARAVITADNVYRLSVNGQAVGSGSDFHARQTYDVARLLRAGDNEIAVAVDNTGDQPNPAGLICGFELRRADGTVERFDTDRQWSAASGAVDDWHAARDLGPAAMGPWHLAVPDLAAAREFPEYEVTSALLKRLGVVPDFDGPDEIRFTHRRDASADYYFIANSADRPIDAACRFRVSRRTPQWWDPITGRLRPLPQFKSDGATTEIPIHLEPGESDFVVFAATNDLATDIGAANFASPTSIATLRGPWEISFDPKRGGPPSPVVWPDLVDWSTRPEPGIRHYSGQATYRATFDAPANRAGLELSLGPVKNIASVKLNGRDLGVVWCDPWRIAIPDGCLRDRGNQLEVTVANLWINRLIGDAGLKLGERITRTTRNPYHANDPLQPSGLLGPVQVIAVR